MRSKTIKKIIAAAVVAAMGITSIVPAAPAQAAAKTKKLTVKTKKITLYKGAAAGYGSMKLKVTVKPKKAKVTYKINKKKIASVSKKGVVKAKKPGKAKITVKSGSKKVVVKVVVKKIKKKVTKVTAPKNVTVKVGAKQKIKTSVKPKKATLKKLTFKSSAKKIAKVNAKGVITGVKAGKATITATLKIGKDTATATQDVEVKNVILKSVAQKKASQIVATFAGDTSKLDKKDITITNTANNVVYPVKAISVAADKKTVKIDTYSEMNDAKEYSVKYDGTEVTFTATDGTVADVGVSTTTIVKGTAGTEVKAQFLDKNQVVVKEFTLSDASNDGSVDFNFTENKGYTDGNKLVLLNVGDTATAEVTYHTNKYDQTTGAETGKITKKFTITAVEDDATLSNFNYTINAKNTQVNWNIDVKTDNKLAVKDTAYAFYQKFQ